MGMRFEWDEQKAATNLIKHGISFEEALTAFDDPLAYLFYDQEHSEEEPREILIGYSRQSRLLLICFIERVTDVVRLISARRATPTEQKDYEENAQKQSPFFKPS